MHINSALSNLTYYHTHFIFTVPSFLDKFFPDIYSAAEAESEEQTNAYCAYDSQLLSLFTSSFFLAGMATSLPASWVTEKYGRKMSMAIGSVLYLLGSVLNVVAVDTAMLIIGRIILGAGCGFVNQRYQSSLPKYLPLNSGGLFKHASRLMSILAYC